DFILILKERLSDINKNLQMIALNITAKLATAMKIKKATLCGSVIRTLDALVNTYQNGKVRKVAQVYLEAIIKNAKYDHVVARCDDLKGLRSRLAAPLDKDKDDKINDDVSVKLSSGLLSANLTFNKPTALLASLLSITNPNALSIQFLKK
ncbi:5790_t:CDS:2, partial [Funneliformis mosseae]